MRSHNGMRPQDIVILLKVIIYGEHPWQNKDLASELFLSPAEISLSLQRSAVAGLINPEKRRVHRQTLMEFIEYGLHVVFPVIPGGIVNGLPTAHSHPFIQQFIKSERAYVWPDAMGKVIGESILPLYDNVTHAAAKDDDLYKMLALIDVIRVGKTRELKIAIEELHRIIL
ncbi:hypothetical protein [Dinghuibacter silviterrae]|uniref:Uncharacterized protein n=1 Tax=Dinghuibacter silviterrae TaxID=1539049 RepID=A0A4R8DG29_9BACT|nr:hypothetical protein [Dinghuibacter silviterrae]TDW96407.1 hypothetical protein EDB95_4237 [Dinghuibacter silviterrae]